MLDWLDVTASLCVQNIEPVEIRQQLAETISGTVHGVDAQRKTIDVLSAIWVKTEKSTPQIRQEALRDISQLCHHPKSGCGFIMA